MVNDKKTQLKRKQAVGMRGGYSGKFIRTLAEYMITKDTLITLRSLSTHFNRAMKSYLPARLHQ